MGVFQTIKIADLVKSGEATLQTGPFGTQLKASDYVEEGTPVINVRNVGFGDIREKDLEFLDEKMVEKLSTHQLEHNDIVFGRKGAVERHAFIDDIGIGWIQGSDCLRLRIKSKRINNRFMSYYLKTKSHQDWMMAVCSFGATMASLNQDIVKLITIPLPPIDIQNKIAALLSAYDNLILNNTRRIALLENMAEEIYREWFVRFRFPGYQSTDFEKGVPKGWKYLKLPTLANVYYGFPFKSEKFNSNGIGKPIVRIRNIPKSHTESFTEEVASDKYLIQTGEILIGMDGEFHMNHWYGPESYLVQRVCKVVAREDIFKGYLYRALKAPIKHYESILMGATVGHLGAKHLNNIEILVPPKEMIERLYIFNDLESQKKQLALINNQLKITKDTLLPRIVSGKLSLDQLNIQFSYGMTFEQKGNT